MSMRTNTIIAFSIIILALSSGCASTISATREKAVAMEEMGTSLVLQGSPREGLGYLVNAAELDPSSPSIQHKLALVYQDLGEYNLSLQHFQKAIDLRPNFSEAINNMGILYSELKEWDLAIQCFQKAISDILYETPHYAYHNMGLVYFQKGEYAKAIESYQKAMNISPSYVDVHYDLASAYEVSGRPSEAIEAYKKAASLTPDPWQAHLSMGKLYLKMDRQQEAISEFELIIESDPRSQAAKEAIKLMDNLQ